MACNRSDSETPRPVIKATLLRHFSKAEGSDGVLVVGGLSVDAEFMSDNQFPISHADNFLNAKIFVLETHQILFFIVERKHTLDFTQNRQKRSGRRSDSWSSV